MRRRNKSRGRSKDDDQFKPKAHQRFRSTSSLQVPFLITPYKGSFSRKDVLSENLESCQAAIPGNSTPRITVIVAS
eukprot:1630616-Pyramimonas_sp.AAC.1